ncbi:MAG: ABC transporter substrate-binding protein [Thalassobaculales bacterium]
MRVLAPLFAVALGLSAPALAAKDTVVIGLQQEPTTLDPTADATASIDTMMAGNVFEMLTIIDQAGSVQPLLASGWTISPDALTYTFTLVKGASFSDGKPLDAGTVKYSFDRAMAPDSTNPSKTIFAPIASVAAPDAGTVVITLKQPDSLFLFNLAQGDAAIVHPDTAAGNKTAPVGSGPYKLKSWVKGDRLVLERNPRFRDPAGTSMREVTFRFISDPSAAVAALLSGDIDAFPNVPAPESLKQFERDRRFKVAVGTTEGEVILAMNHARKPFDDIRVRRAISHLIDRKAIIDGAMFGYGQPIGSHFAPHNPAYVDLTGRYPLDIAKAKALLAEAGLANGFETVLRPPPFPYARRTAEILQSQLAAAGIKVKIENVEWGFWIGEVFKGNYDLTIVAHVAPNDISNYARGKSYYWGYESPEFAALYANIRKETDQGRLTALLKQAQEKIAEDAVNGFLFQLPQMGVYKAELTGYRVNATVNYAPVTTLKWTN